MELAAKDYEEILRSELIPALGCTEPIAIALAAAKARDVLGMEPEHLELFCSGNIVKNVKGVTVPNSGGMKGIDVAGILGTVCGNADRKLEVLSGATSADVEKTKELLNAHYADCHLQEDVTGLYVRAEVCAKGHKAAVTIDGMHTFISRIEKDGEILRDAKPEKAAGGSEKKKDLTMRGIYDYAVTADLAPVRDIMLRQIEYNEAISKEGMTGKYGAAIGKTLLSSEGTSINVRARAMAAAGSDARMNGCPLPVVINSGSGNQGMTVSLPILAYARELNVSEDTLLRALLIGNLTAIHQKTYIGSLSAFCGAVSAACGTGAGITFLYGGTFEQISSTVINSLANTSGIICDGAKASCAAKIASAVEAAIIAHNMSMHNITFKPGDGVIMDNVEDTMRSIGYVGRVGMKETDHDILKIMLGNVDFGC